MRQSKDYWSRRSSSSVASTRRGGKIFAKIRMGLLVPYGGHPHDAPNLFNRIVSKPPFTAGL